MSAKGKNPERTVQWSDDDIQTATEIHRERAPDFGRDDEQTDNDGDYTNLPGYSSDASPFTRNQRIKITEEDWMYSITVNPLRFSSVVSIFKVRMFLKDIKREAYVPKRVSLGPYHQGRPELPQMNHHKGRAVRRMMIRRNTNMGIDPNNMDFAFDAMNVILELRHKIKDIYQEPIRCDGKTLARMLCLDGCFILEVLRTLGGESNDPNDTNEKNDPIFGENKVATSNLLKDILMLENQIPWIVLLKLLGLVLRIDKPPSDEEHPNDEEHRKAKHVERTLLNMLMEGTCRLFKFSDKDKSALMEWNWLDIEVQPVHHLLGFLHKVIVHRPASPDEPKSEGCIDQCLIMLQGKSKASNDIESIPPAVELKHAGIKFGPCKGGIKKINFDTNTATVYLPTVSITYGTEVLFRNLIAFEICRPSEGNYVTSYVALMNDLIDSEEDVALLRSVGILTTLLGSDKEVADLFNGLCNEATVRTEVIFDELRKGVNAHYKNKIRIQFAELLREHFSSPWKTLALVEASLILILTLIQTIFTIIKK